MTICLKPNRGPKDEKNATGNKPKRVKKNIVNTESTNPSLKTGQANAPVAKVLTAILAESHWRRMGNGVSPKTKLEHERWYSKKSKSIAHQP